MAESTKGLRDVSAENAVLCGILHEPNEMFRQLAKLGLTEDHFGHHLQLVAFGILKELWTKGTHIDPVTAWRFFKRELPGDDKIDLAAWICDLWVLSWWDEKIGFFWVESPLDKLSTGYASRGLAAAAKVKWLASRRNAIHRANQVIRDAVDGVTGPDDYEDQF